MARSFKRVLFTSDKHCGHRVGLTPPEFFSGMLGKKFQLIQDECWRLYSERVESLKPIDIHCDVGDVVDGTGSRSAATELITTDINRQLMIAKPSYTLTEAPVTRQVRGTPYHASPDGQDAEDRLTEKLPDTTTHVSDHDWFDVNGTTFDVKHHIGNSEQYKGTPLTKQHYANLLWNDYSDSQPRADVFIRGHIHHYFFCGDPTFLAMSLPALQAAATKFGARRCSFPVHWGLVHFDCYDDGSYKWEPFIRRVENSVPQVAKL